MFTTIQKPTLLLNDKRTIKNIRTNGRKGAKKRRQVQGRILRLINQPKLGIGSENSVSKPLPPRRLIWRITLPTTAGRILPSLFLANILEIELIRQLVSQIKLGLLVESQEVVKFLAENLTPHTNIWLKVDVGYGRTGIAWSDFEKFGALARHVAEIPQLSLRGLLTHSGHTYNARSKAEIEKVYI